MKKTRLKAAEKVQRPVSQKFYDEIQERVKAVCFLLAETYGYAYDIPRAIDDMMHVIELYMAGEITPEECGDINTKLVLSTLCAEIDRAMERSAKARARSFKRRKSMTSGHKQAVSELTETTAEIPVAAAEPEPAPAPKPMNRRQRRLIEQELRREARKEMRRLAAQTSEKKAGVAV